MFLNKKDQPYRSIATNLRTGIIVIIIITFKTANPNWESQTPKIRGAQQGRQASKERENFSKKRKQR